MGLDVDGWSSDKTYHCGYSGIHQIRWLGAILSGFMESYSDFMKLYERDDIPMDKRFSRFEQLMHFSDSEGIFVPEWFLRKVDYKESYYLGNSTKLLDELRIIKFGIYEMYKDKDYFNERTKVFESRAFDIFKELFELVEDEVINGKGILVFH